jgi:hypothetical protein
VACARRRGRAGLSRRPPVAALPLLCPVAKPGGRRNSLTSFALRRRYHPPVPDCQSVIPPFATWQRHSTAGGILRRTHSESGRRAAPVQSSTVSQTGGAGAVSEQSRPGRVLPGGLDTRPSQRRSAGAPRFDTDPPFPAGDRSADPRGNRSSTCEFAWIETRRPGRMQHRRLTESESSDAPS